MERAARARSGASAAGDGETAALWTCLGCRKRLKTWREKAGHLSRALQLGQHECTEFQRHAKLKGEAKHADSADDLDGRRGPNWGDWNETYEACGGLSGEEQRMETAKWPAHRIRWYEGWLRERGREIPEGAVQAMCKVADMSRPAKVASRGSEGKEEGPAGGGECQGEKDPRSCADGSCTHRKG